MFNSVYYDTRLIILHVNFFFLPDNKLHFGYYCWGDKWYHRNILSYCKNIWRWRL